MVLLAPRKMGYCGKMEHIGLGLLTNFWASEVKLMEIIGYKKAWTTLLFFFIPKIDIFCKAKVISFFSDIFNT